MRRQNQFRTPLAALVALGLFGVAYPAAAAPEGAASSGSPVLSVGEDRLGVSVEITAGSLVLKSCGEKCSESDPSVRLSLPEGVEKLERSEKTVKLKGGSEALLLRFGPTSRAYTVVVLGAKKDSSSKRPPSPLVALKGWSGVESKSGSELKIVSKKGGSEILLVSPSHEVACSRSAPKRLRRLDSERGKFRTVKRSVLSDAERASMAQLSAVPSASPTESLLQLESSGKGSATAPVDSDRSTSWSAAYDYVELTLPSEAAAGELLLEFPSPQKEASEVYLLSEGQAARLILPSSEERFYRVTVPEKMRGGCLALSQPRKPAQISEVMAVGTEPSRTTDELVSELTAGPSRLALLSLPLRGAETSKALSSSYARMDEAARARAREVASRMGAGGLDVFVSALEFGSETERTAAVGALLAYEKESAEVVARRIATSKPAGAAHLSITLAGLDPELAAEVLPTQLDRKSSALRTHLRKVISRIASDKKAGEILQAQLKTGKSKDFELSRNAKVELARALAPRLLDWQLLPVVEDLAEEATFGEAYLLAPIAFERSAESSELKGAFSRWLSGKSAGESSSNTQAALSARSLEILSDRTSGPEKSRLELLPEIAGLINSENMRVRRAAFVTGGLLPEVIDREEAYRALSRDSWPSVRASAALLLGEQLALEANEKTVKVLTKRLRKDKHPVARRAIARSLSSSQEEVVVKALRRSFSKDESYEVRAESALSLGHLCDSESLDALTSRARSLTQAPAGDGPILLGLASVSALAQINPPDLEKRLAPLLSEEQPGLLRVQVQQRLDTVESSSRPACSK